MIRKILICVTDDYLIIVKLQKNYASFIGLGPGGLRGKRDYLQNHNSFLRLKWILNKKFPFPTFHQADNILTIRKRREFKARLNTWLHVENVGQTKVSNNQGKNATQLISARKKSY